MPPSNPKQAAPAAPSTADVQAYLFAQLATFFENVDRIADALEVIAQTQLTIAAIQQHATGVAGVFVNNEGVLTTTATSESAGPVLYADDEESSPETKPGSMES